MLAERNLDIERISFVAKDSYWLNMDDHYYKRNWKIKKEATNFLEEQGTTNNGSSFPPCICIITLISIR